jgi:hypothetical protein
MNSLCEIGPPHNQLGLTYDELERDMKKNVD